MFYVIYNTETKQYLNIETQEFGSFADATQFGSIADAAWDLADTNTALEIVVGPCREGEEP